MLNSAARDIRKEIKARPQPILKHDVMPTETTVVRSLSVKAPLMNGTTVVGLRTSGTLPDGRSRFSAIVKKSGLQSKSYEARMADREEQRRVKAKQDALMEAAKEERRKEHRRIKQRQEQRAENDRKSAVVQRISNPKKLKKLTPKQMRQIIKM